MKYLPQIRFNSRQLLDSILLLVVSIGLSLLLCNVQNTLHHNGNWTSKKISLQKSVMGAIAYVTSRVALSNNELNLSSWFGFQEVTLKNRTYNDTVEFDYVLENDRSYFIFYFAKRDNIKLGIRISRYKIYPNSFIAVDQKGKFVDRSDLQLSTSEIKDGRLALKLIDDTVEFSFSGKNIYLPSKFKPFLKDRYIALRGGMHKVTVDNLSIDPTTENRFQDNFSNYNHLFTYFILLTVVLIGLLRKLKIKQNNTSAVLFTAAINILFIVWVDYAYLSHRYIFLNPLDSSEYSTDSEDEFDVKERLNKQLLSARSKQRERILFIGTSQTWGAGALDKSDALVEQIRAHLNRTYKNKYEVINTSISGWNSTLTLKEYTSNWYKFKPRTVVINLSNNDNNQANFENNMKDFVKFNNKMKVKTVFILEANSIEERRTGIVPYHRIMNKIATRYNLQVIDLHNHLKKLNDTGFLWWDYIHLSSFGHAQAAKLIINQIRSW